MLNSDLLSAASSAELRLVRQTSAEQSPLIPCKIQGAWREMNHSWNEYASMVSSLLNENDFATIVGHCIPADLFVSYRNRATPYEQTVIFQRF